VISVQFSEAEAEAEAEAMSPALRESSSARAPMCHLQPLNSASTK